MNDNNHPSRMPQAPQERLSSLIEAIHFGGGRSGRSARRSIADCRPGPRALRMGVRRYTRNTNAFSKRRKGHLRMVALFMLYYNFVRIHRTLRVTPAMAAGLSDTVHELDWIVGLIGKK